MKKLAQFTYKSQNFCLAGRICPLSDVPDHPHLERFALSCSSSAFYQCLGRSAMRMGPLPAWAADTILSIPKSWVTIQLPEVLTVLRNFENSQETVNFLHIS